MSSLPKMNATKTFSIEPMLCQSADLPPEGREWCYELKLDGFRAIGRKSGRSAQLWSRNQRDFTRRFPGVIKGIAELPDDTVIDSEIVALDEKGRPSFTCSKGSANPRQWSFTHSTCSCWAARM
jgi:ATP-dependent DNA ligase